MLSALDTGFQDGFLSFLDRDIGKVHYRRKRR